MKPFTHCLRLGLTAAAVSLAATVSFADWVPVVQANTTPGYGGYVRAASAANGKLWVLTEGGGLHKSADDGATWTASNTGLSNLRVRAGFISAGATESVTKVFAGTSGGGVFKSLDGGASFTAINSGLNCTYVTALSSSATSRLFAGTDCGSASGVYYSDAGNPWVMGTGMPTDIRVRSVSQINPSGSGVDYLLASTVDGIWKSTDSGASWSRLTASPSGPNGSVVYHVRYMTYTNASSVSVIRLIATVEGAGVFISEDAGATWTASNAGLPANPKPLSSVNSSGGTLFLSLDGAGTYKSDNRGASWTLLSNEAALPNARFVFGTAPNFYAGTVAGPFKSADGGATWTKGGTGLSGGWTTNTQIDTAGKWYAAAADGVYQRDTTTSQWSRMASIPAMSSGHVIVRGTAVYATTDSAGIFKYSGSAWQAINTGLPANLLYRRPNLRIDSTSPTAWYAGLYGDGVYYTADDGASWTARNTGLTGDALKVHHMSTAGALIYISTEAGVYKSADRGLTWVFVFAPKNNAGTVNKPASHVWIDQLNPSTVYAGAFNTDALGMSLNSNGVWKSTDGGATWTQLAGMAGKKVRAVYIAAADNNLVASAWDDAPNGGFFSSKDGGATWKNGSVGLTSNLVNSITASNDGGLAATRGAGLFSYVDSPQSNEWKYFGVWTNGNQTGYGVSYGANDPTALLSGITVSGGGQSAVASYWSDKSWHADMQFGATSPPTGNVYTATVTPKTGAVTTTSFSIRASGYNTKYPTAIQPSGGANVLAVNPTFTWGPPTVGGTFTYGINVHRASDNTHIWSTFSIPSTTTAFTYAGPALVAGTTYRLSVQTQEWDSATNSTYGASRSETFCFQCASGGTGVNFDQIFISRNMLTTGENFGVSVRYPRTAGDGNVSYSIVCPNNVTSAGTFAAVTAPNTQWVQVNFGNSPPATPFNCTSTVSYANVATTVATVTVDRFADTARYVTNLSLNANANVQSLAGITFTLPVLASGDRIQANIFTKNAQGFSDQQVWFVGNTASPIDVTTLPTLTPNTSYILFVAVVDGTSTMHAAQTMVPFCYQCTGTGGGTGGTLPVVAGWNLLGNSNSAILDVATAFGDVSKVTSVWKWNPATSKWAFYAPSLAASGGLATFASGKGYDVLTSIAGGEGFWVNAVSPFNATLPTGNAVTSASFATTLPSGWSLIGLGDNKTPRAFNNALSGTPPAAGVLAASVLTSLWAWDSGRSAWYFYAPALDNNGSLASYASDKGYLDFGTSTIQPGIGFWVNKP